MKNFWNLYIDGTLLKVVDVVIMQILPNLQELVEIGTKFIYGKNVIKVKVCKGNAFYYNKRIRADW